MIVITNGFLFGLGLLGSVVGTVFVASFLWHFWRWNGARIVATIKVIGFYFSHPKLILTLRDDLRAGRPQEYIRSKMS